MVFSSPIFLFVFLPVTYLGYRLLPGLSLRNAWLTLASLIFFSFGQLPYLVLLLISVFINYLFGQALRNLSPAAVGIKPDPKGLLLSRLLDLVSGQFCGLGGQGSAQQKGEGQSGPDPRVFHNDPLSLRHKSKQLPYHTQQAPSLWSRCRTDGKIGSHLYKLYSDLQNCQFPILIPRSKLPLPRSRAAQRSPGQSGSH